MIRKDSKENLNINVTELMIPKDMSNPLLVRIDSQPKNLDDDFKKKFTEDERANADNAN